MTEVVFSSDARRRLIRGMSIPVNAIASAFGPMGRSAIFHCPPASPEIVVDGLSIAREFQHTKSVERQGSRILYESMYDFDRDYGDGNSSLALIIHDIMVQSNMLLEAEFSPVQLVDSLFDSAKLIENRLEELSQPFDDDRHSIPICQTAAGDYIEVARKVDSLVRNLGPDGYVDVKEGYGLETSEMIYPGMTLPAGLVSSELKTSNFADADSYDEPFILLCDEKIEDFGRLVPILEGFARTDKSLVIICRDLVGSALATLIVNVKRAGLKAAAVAVPEVGDRVYEVLEDLAAFTAGTVVSQRLGYCLQSLRPEMLGRADRVEVDSNKCLFICKDLDRRMIDARKQAIRDDLRRVRYLSYDRERLQIRLARLSGGFAELRVGSHSLPERKQHMLRYQKALCALQSAKRSGVLPGAGSICAQIASQLDERARENSIGYKILASALRRPLFQLIESVGIESTPGIRSDATGKSHSIQVFDVRKREYTENCNAEIYDSAEIVRAYIRCAVSIAGTLLKSGVSITRM